MHIFIINNASMMKIISLYEAMDGRALLQLYKIGISRSNKTDALLNDGLKSTYKMRLRIGVYTRFWSTISHLLRISVVDNIASPYFLHFDQTYNLLITSDASALEILRAISTEKFVSMMTHIYCLKTSFISFEVNKKKKKIISEIF